MAYEGFCNNESDCISGLSCMSDSCKGFITESCCRQFCDNNAPIANISCCEQHQVYDVFCIADEGVCANDNQCKGSLICDQGCIFNSSAKCCRYNYSIQ